MDERRYRPRGDVVLAGLAGGLAVSLPARPRGVQGEVPA
jgi:hypothetical protein